MCLPRALQKTRAAAAGRRVGFPVSYLHCRERPDIEAYACLYVIWQTIQYFSLKSSMTGSLRALLDGPQREGGIVPKKKNNNRKLARWVDPGD